MSNPPATTMKKMPQIKVRESVRTFDKVARWSFWILMAYLTYVSAQAVEFSLPRLRARGARDGTPASARTDSTQGTQAASEGHDQ